ncbi:MAG: hypothetical protein ACLP3B_16870 [Syntrophobacteraceae bacterium]
MQARNIVLTSIAVTLFCATSVCAKDKLQKNSSQIDVVSNPHDKRAEAFCEEIYNTINTLVPFTTTLCAPAKGATKGSLSLLVMSPKKIVGEDSRKFWISMSVATVGAIMRKKHDNVIVDELILIDT